MLDAEEVKMRIDGSLPLEEKEPKGPTSVARRAGDLRRQESERKAPLTPPILQNPGSVPQS